MFACANGLPNEAEAEAAIAQDANTNFPSCASADWQVRRLLMHTCMHAWPPLLLLCLPPCSLEPARAACLPPTHRQAAIATGCSLTVLSNSVLSGTACSAPCAQTLKSAHCALAFLPGGCCGCWSAAIQPAGACMQLACWAQ